MASIAARASARAAPVSPVGISRGAIRRSASAASASVLRLQRVDDRVDLAAGVAQPLLDPLFELAAERFLPVPQLLLARAAASRPRLRERFALARGEPPFVIERLHVPLDLCQVFGQLRLARAPVRACLLDHVGGHAEAVGDLERETAARRRRSSGGRSARTSRGLKPNPGRHHALGRRGVRLQRVVVGRRDHHRAAAAEVIDDRHRERAAFERDRCRRPPRRAARATGSVERLVHRDDVGDVAGERAQARRDRLLVADVGKDRAETPGSAILRPQGSAAPPAPSATAAPPS